MNEIIIVSNDICLVKQIIYTVNKVYKKKNSPIINIYNFKEIKKNSHDVLKRKNVLYFFDINSIEEDVMDILRKNKKYMISSKIIFISISDNYRCLSQSHIYSYIKKDTNLYKELYEIIFNIKNNFECKKNISNNETPVILNINKIDSIYKWPNDLLSIYYKGKNNILLPIDDVSKIIKTDVFYTPKKELTNKRKTYDDSFKQLIVDLYLIYHIDHKIISDYFKVDIKDIKRWSELKKYNKKRSFIKVIIGKMLIKNYLKNK